MVKKVVDCPIKGVVHFLRLKGKESEKVTICGISVPDDYYKTAVYNDDPNDDIICPTCLEND